MGDTRPLANNEVYFSTMEFDGSPNDLNHTDDTSSTHRFGGDRKSSGILSPYSVNGRLLVLAIAGVAFILSLILFIATVVVYAGSGSSSSSNCLEATPATTPLPIAVFPSPAATQAPVTANPFDEPLSVTRVNGVNVKRGALVWSEEFETFNTSRWRHLNHDPDTSFFHLVDTRNNSFVKQGVLHLKPTFTSDAYGSDYLYNGTLFLGRTPSATCKGRNDSAFCWKGEGIEIVHPIMVPVISTQESFAFRYGLLEIRAKMPAGDWIEPLMSLQPNESAYGEFGMLNGQVQMIDTRGNRKLYDANGINIGSEQTCPDIRLGNHKTRRFLFDCLNTPQDQGFDTDFHLYQVEWTPESLTLKIDGNGIVSAPFPRKSMFELWSRGRVSSNPWASAENSVMAPFDKNFYLVLGLHVGGTLGFFSDDSTGPYPKPWSDSEGSTAAKSFWEKRHDWEPSWAGDAGSMQIDYIRLYALNRTLIEEDGGSQEGFFTPDPAPTDALSSEWNNWSEKEDEEEEGDSSWETMEDDDFYMLSLYSTTKRPHHHTHNTRNNTTTGSNSTQIKGLEEAIIDSVLI